MIKLAIIGTNWITEKFIDAALQTGLYQLSAIYSRSEEKAAQFAKKYGNPILYTDINQLLNSSEVGAVYIASPNSLHYEQAKQLLESGKDVICEKPLASNYTQVSTLVDTAKQHNQIIFEALKSYYLPNFDSIKSNLPKLGKLRKVLLSYCQYSSRYQLYLDGQNPNTFNPAFSNGSIMDIGVYPLNVAVALWGKPNHISADALLLNSGVDGHGTVLMKYDGFDVIIWHSKVSDSCLASEIQGEDGSLIIEHLSVGEKVLYKPRQGELQDITVPQIDNEMYYEAVKFAQAIEQRDINHQGLTYSLISAKLLTEIRQQTGVIFPADKLS